MTQSASQKEEKQALPPPKTRGPGHSLGQSERGPNPPGLAPWEVSAFDKGLGSVDQPDVTHQGSSWNVCFHTF